MVIETHHNELPKIFIGSSKEGIKLARLIQTELQHDAISNVWNQTFSASKVTILNLLENLEKCDFGIFVLTPDDPVLIRGKEVKIARDNVILEMGMYIGKLGLERTFFVIPEGDYEFHLPSDLSGVVWAGYKPQFLETQSEFAIAIACNQIRTQIGRLGQRSIVPVTPSHITNNQIRDYQQALAILTSELKLLGVGRESRNISIPEMGKKLDIEIGTIRNCIETAILEAGLKMDKKYEDTVIST